MRGFATDAGRDPSSIGMETRINLTDGDPEFWQARAGAWKALGATHISVNTMRAGLKSPDDHIHAIQQFKDAVSA